MPVLVMVAFIFLTASGGMGVRQLQQDAAFAVSVGDVQVFVQQMTRDVLLASQNDKYAAGRIKAAEARVSQGLAAIQETSDNMMSLAGGASTEQLDKLNATWDQLRKLSNAVLAVDARPSRRNNWPHWGTKSSLCRATCWSSMEWAVRQLSGSRWPLLPAC